MLITLLLYWLSHRPVGIYLSIVVQNLGGNVATFGLVAGLGAFVEAAVLLFGAGIIRRNSVRKMMTVCLLINFIRPIMLFSGNIVLLVIGQLVQSVGLSLYYVVSVESLNRVSPVKIKTTAITFGLSVLLHLLWLQLCLLLQRPRVHLLTGL